jgi:BirA family biotin operon repressor/biotin-[acetyl-CoA-carboxylase] ligase
VLTAESFSLLQILKSDEACPGYALAAMLAVPKNKIPQLVEELESSGIEIERVSGKGYKLAREVRWFSLAAWREAMLALGAKPAEVRVLKPSELRKRQPVESTEVLLPATHPKEDGNPNHSIILRREKQVDSTSSEWLKRASRHDIHGQALLAEWQSAGRGRHGNPWLSLPEGSLTFSLGWRFATGGGFLGGLPLAVSVAVVRALSLEGFSDIALKWPNDLVHHYQKLGGILVELSGDALGPTQAVIGIGLNISLPRDSRSEISQAVTDLSKLSKGRKTPINREALLARIFVEIVRALETYAEKGFIAFASDWQKLHIYHQRQVKLLLPDGQTVKGQVVGVDANGALVLSQGNFRHRYTAGEVSLQRLEK